MRAPLAFAVAFPGSAILLLASCPPNPYPVPTPSQIPTVSPSTAPSPLTCPAPTWGAALGKRVATQVALVDALLVEVMAAHHEHFDGQHVAGWPQDPQDPEGERKANEFGAWLVSAASARGVCAVWTDELVIVLPGYGESYRVLGWGRGRVWDAANAYHGDSLIVGASPPASPPPTVPPVTAPATPSPVACQVAGEDVVSWRVIAKSNPGNQQVDVTPVACGPALVAALNNCGTRCCELSTEKGNQACSDALYGMPAWGATGGVRLVQVYPDNSFTMKVAEGAGEVVVDGKDPRARIHFPVRAGAPACDMVQGSNQGCAVLP